MEKLQEKKGFVQKLRQMTSENRKDELDKKMRQHYDKIQSRWSQYVATHNNRASVGEKRKCT